MKKPVQFSESSSSESSLVKRRPMPATMATVTRQDYTDMVEVVPDLVKLVIMQIQILWPSRTNIVCVAVTEMIYGTCWRSPMSSLPWSTTPPWSSTPPRVRHRQGLRHHRLRPRQPPQLRLWPRQPREIRLLPCPIPIPSHTTAHHQGKLRQHQPAVPEVQHYQQEGCEGEEADPHLQLWNYQEDLILVLFCILDRSDTSSQTWRMWERLRLEILYTSKINLWLILNLQR